MRKPRYRPKWQRRPPMPASLARFWEEYESRRFMASLYPEIDYLAGKRN